jgi:hypothetical protein
MFLERQAVMPRKTEQTFCAYCGLGFISHRNSRLFCTASCFASHRNTTHGLSDRPEYSIWFGMKRRCLDSRRPEFVKYGGRGITICDRWTNHHGFENFLADMGDRPSQKHSIDRIDNNGNYEPSNCRWATKSTQTINRSMSVLTEDLAQEIRGRFEHGESRRSIAVRLGLKRSAVYPVIANRTWLPDDAQGEKQSWSVRG